MGKFRIRWSVAWMITLTTVSVVALSIGATIALDVRRERIAAVAELKERAELLASHMGDMAAKPLLAEDAQALASVAHMMAALPDVGHVRLVGADGRVLATMDGHGGSMDMGSMDMGSMDMDSSEAASRVMATPDGGSTPAAGVVARALSTRERVVLMGNSHLSIASPVVVADELVGVAQLDLDVPSLDGQIRQMVLDRVRQASALLALAALVSYALAQYLAQPIRQLVRAARKVAEGDLSDFPPRAKRSDEIGELTVAFAEMTRSLRAARETVAESTASLSEKEALLKEVHHRVKNNLQIISSLLSLQASASSDPEAVSALKESEARVRSMALVHEKLYQSHDLSNIDLGDYLADVAGNLVRSFDRTGDTITLEVDAAPLIIDADMAVSCGLIANELISNAVKHAFPDGRRGTIGIELSEDADGLATFIVHDDGVGMPADVDWAHMDSLGLQLVPQLARGLGGTAAFSANGGTTCTITFPTGRSPTGNGRTGPGITEKQEISKL